MLLASLNPSAVTAGRYLVDVVRTGDVVDRRGDFQHRVLPEPGSGESNTKRGVT